jgi:hypothetical protein
MARLQESLVLEQEETNTFVYINNWLIHTRIYIKVRATDSVKWKLIWENRSCGKQKAQPATNCTFKIIFKTIDKANPLQAYYRPWRFKEVEAPRFQDNRDMTVVKLSALIIGRNYPQKYSRYPFLLEAESTLGPECGRKDSLCNHDNLACSAVPPSAALPRTLKR